MRKTVVYSIVIMAVSFAACKSKDAKSDSADSGQVHVGGSSSADSSKYPVSPVETGGQDTSADGTINTNPAKDTVKK